jgi:hypothetical protein
MKSRLLAQRTISLTRADNLQGAQTHDSTYVQTEEQTVIIPDIEAQIYE